MRFIEFLLKYSLISFKFLIYCLFWLFKFSLLVKIKILNKIIKIRATAAVDKLIITIIGLDENNSMTKANTIKIDVNANSEVGYTKGS